MWAVTRTASNARWQPLDSSLRMGVTPDELMAASSHCRTWPGARMAEGALPIADGRAANPGESWSRVDL